MRAVVWLGLIMLSKHMKQVLSVAGWGRRLARKLHAEVKHLRMNASGQIQGLAPIYNRLGLSLVEVQWALSHVRINARHLSSACNVLTGLP